MDSHNLNIYFGVLIITCLAIICGVIENLYKIRPSKGTYNLIAWYELLNFNLSLSLGLIAIFWEKEHSNPRILIVIFFLMLFGMILKITKSEHQPERISLKDKDFRWGVIFPNAFAFSSISIMIFRDFPDLIPNLIPIFRDFSEKSRQFIVFPISFAIGSVLSFLFGYGAELFLRDNLSGRAIDTIAKSELINQLLKKSKNSSLTADEEKQIWNALMEYCAKTTVEYRAINYIDAVYCIVKNEELKKSSLQTIEERFSKCKECTK